MTHIVLRSAKYVSSYHCIEEPDFRSDLMQTMPNATTPTSPGVRQARRHNPLSDDLVASGPLRTKSKKRKATADGPHGDDNYVDAKSSRRILDIGQALADEDREENHVQAPNMAFAFESRLGGDSDSDGEGQDREDEEAW